MRIVRVRSVRILRSLEAASLGSCGGRAIELGRADFGAVCARDGRLVGFLGPSIVGDLVGLVDGNVAPINILLTNRSKIKVAADLPSNCSLTNAGQLTIASRGAFFTQVVYELGLVGTVKICEKPFFFL